MSNINLYNSDCLLAMAGMEDKQYQLAICDPPYGISMDGGKYGIDGAAEAKSYTQKDWDKNAPTQEYFNELRRVSVNQIIWGANHFISKIPHDSPYWIVWDKEKVGSYFADCELAWTSFNSAVRMFKFAWHGFIQKDMKNKEVRIHPTQKPVRLYEYLLKNYAKPGDKILDTHLGSGSSAIACDIMGYDMTGYEIDKDYFQAAKARLERHQKQGKLFG